MTHRLLASLAIAALLSSPVAAAAPGDLDPTFGDGGVVLRGTFNAPDQAHAVAVQGDGRIVVAGTAYGAGGFRASVVRLLADGTPDPSFGAGGMLSVDWGERYSRAFAVAVQPDGRLVIGGFTNESATSRFALLRLLPNGDLDPTFGTGGRVATAFPGGGSVINALAIQPDGRIVAAGTATSGGVPSSSAFALARYLADGTLDAGFGTGGLVVDDLTTATDAANAVALQPDGKIVVAGFAINPGAATDFTLARYLATGTRDAAFGAAGVVTIAPTASSDFGHAVLVQPDGAIVAAGTALNGLGGQDALVVRLTPAGALDATFNGTGSRAITFPPGITTAFAVGRALARQPDGRIVLAAIDNANLVVGVTRLNADGTPDGSFAGGAPALLRTRSGALPIGIALDALGRTILAHADSNGPFVSEDFAVARFSTDGGLDPAFGAGGRLLVETSPGTGGEWSAVARLADGKIVVAGKAAVGTAECFAVARLNADGTFDSSFGEGGIAVSRGAGTGTGHALALAILADGRIVAAGRSETSVGSRGVVVRFLRDGQLDPSFGTGGRLEYTDQPPQVSEFRAVAILPDERLVVAGNAFDTQYRIAYSRVLPDGSIDFTVGVQALPTGSSFDTVSALALQPDGKSVIAGQNMVDGHPGPTLMRVTIGGVLDASFGAGGIVTDATRAAGMGAHNAVAVQPDGRIVTAGTGPAGHPQLMRWNADGTPDTGFGTGGKVESVLSAGGGLANAVAVLPGGRLLVAGLTLISPSWDAFVARYEANGAIDTTFGAGTGWRRVDLDQSYDAAAAMVVQPDGKAVVAGIGSNSAMVFRMQIEQAPDPFAFAPQSGVGLSTVVTSGAATITGITGLVPVSVSGGSYSVGCTATFTSQPGFIAANVPVCVRHVSASAPSTAITTTLTIGAVSASFTSTTEKAVPGVSVAASANPTAAGSSVTFTATVTGLFGTPTGLVTFRDGTIVIGAASLGAGGQAQLSTSGLFAGARSITAAYGGDALYAAATSLALPHTVNAVVAPPPTRGDANGDRKADLVWRDASGGLALWNMDGPSIVSTFFGVVGTEWQVHAVGDANGDGKSDLFWWNATLGSGYVWFLDGNTISGFADLGVIGPEWTLAGAGDFNGDGRADALFRRSTDGLYYTFLLNGGTVTAQGSLGTLPAAWSLAGIGDTDGDGKADLVFRNGADGSVMLWKMNGTAAPVATVVGQADAAFWRVAGVGDFDGDGRADLLWQGDDGSLWAWMMNGAAVTSASAIGTLPGPGWTVRMVADFTGDAKADIVWRFVDGTTYLWIMNGAQILSTPQIPNPGGSWQIAP